jgi:transposase
MAAYSLDLRERIVEAVERRMSSKRKIAEWFGVHESFLYKLLRQKRDRGDLAPLPHGGGAEAKLAAEQLPALSALVAATPDATLEELREQLKKKVRVEVSRSTICRRLQGLGLTRKKRPSAPPKPIPTSGPRSKSSNQR